MLYLNHRINKQAKIVALMQYKIFKEFGNKQKIKKKYKHINKPWNQHLDVLGTNTKQVKTKFRNQYLGLPGMNTKLLKEKHPQKKKKTFYYSIKL